MSDRGIAGALATRLAEEGLSPPILEDLLRYRDDLLRFNRALNLVSRRGGGPVVDRLVLECALAGLVLKLPAGGRLLDIGSGAGLPGLPVALVHREWGVTLLERRRGRCDFLRRERRALGLEEMGILEGDARDFAAEAAHAAGYALVLMKALAPPTEALAIARPFLAAKGVVVLFQRPGWELEPDSWERVASLELDLHPLSTEAAALFLLRPI